MIYVVIILAIMNAMAVVWNFFNIYGFIRVGDWSAFFWVIPVICLNAWVAFSLFKIAKNRKDYEI